jgi:chemotaxis protein CheD
MAYAHATATAPPPMAPEVDVPTDGDGPTVFVHPGQLFVSSDPLWISTILGTCVAVCLYDPITKLGGLNHYLLPHWVGNGNSSTKFGNVATQMLIDKMISTGAHRARIEAKVFGGMSRVPQGTPKSKDLGTNNVELALKLLKGAGIPIIAQSVGGERGRRILFNLKDGSTWVKQF